MKIIRDRQGCADWGGGGAIPKSHRPRTPSLRSVCVGGDWDPCCLYAQICDRAHPRLGGWGVCTRVSVHSHAFAHPALGTLVSVHTRVWAHTYVWVHTCHWQSSPHFSPGPSMPGKHPHALIDLHNAHIRTLRTIYTKKPRQKLIFYFFFPPDLFSHVSTDLLLQTYRAGKEQREEVWRNLS